MNQEKILTIEECRNQAFHYLRTSNLNRFLIDEYIENDDSDIFDDVQYGLCRSIVFDSVFKDNLFFQDANRSDSWFKSVEDQIYKLVTNDNKYAGDTIYLNLILAGVVTGLTNFLVESFSLDAATACGIAYFLVYTIAKIGINTWCQRYEDRQKRCEEKKGND